MQADTFALGTSFLKLVVARDSDLREDIADYDGDNTSLLDCYVLATDADSFDYVYADNLGKVELVRVETVTVIGGDYEVRCYTNEVTAYLDEQGQLWLDAEMHDDVFC
jgi:hypothetical protein